jgi:hypothetical protein
MNCIYPRISAALCILATFALGCGPVPVRPADLSTSSAAREVRPAELDDAARRFADEGDGVASAYVHFREPPSASLLESFDIVRDDMGYHAFLSPKQLRQLAGRAEVRRIELGVVLSAEQLAPELANVTGTFQLHVRRDPKDPERIVVALEWTGEDPLELTRGRQSSDCGVHDWRVTLIAEDGSTYLSTPQSPRRLCFQVIVFERTYAFPPNEPVVVASFLTRHLIGRDGAGPFAAGRYRVLVGGTFGSAVFARADGTATL